MADKKINLDLIINTADSAKNIRDVKKSIKELQNAALEFGEGSEGFEKATRAAANLKDKVEDLNQAINARKGEGFERFNGQLGVLGDKLSNLDFGGANEAISSMAKNFKSISFKDIIGGVKGFGSVMVNLGKALLANPIVLIATIIIAIGVALYALKDKVKIIGDAFAALGKVIDGVIQFFKDLSDAMGFTSFAAEEAAQKQIDAAKKTSEATQDRYDTEIRYAKAAGKETGKLEEEKRKAFRETAYQQMQALIQIKNLNGKLTEEQLEDYNKLVAGVKESRVASKEAAIADATEEANKKAKIAEEAASEEQKKNEKRAADNKKAAEDRANGNKTLLKQIADQNIQLITDDTQRAIAKAKLDNDRAKQAIEESKASNAIKIQALKEQELIYQQDLKTIDDGVKAKKAADDAKIVEDEKAKNAKLLDEANRSAIAVAELNVLKDEESISNQILLLETQKNIELQNAQLTADEKKLIEEKYLSDIDGLKDAAAAKEEARKQKEFDDTLKFGTTAFNAVSSLSDSIFAIKTRNLKKGSAEELKAAKANFNVNKAMQLATATITGIGSVMEAYKNGMKNPIPLLGPATGAVYAVAAGVVSAANIAKIASAKFEGGASVDTSVPPTPQIPTVAAAPRLNDFSLFGTAGSANNLGGSQTTVKAVVVESDITNSQQRVQGFKTASELGG